MRQSTASLVSSGLYAALATLVFCTMISETVFLYPNYFHDVPDSLAVADEFTAVVSVGSVMRPLGAALTLAAVVAVALGLWTKQARSWLIASLLSLVSGLALLSMVYLWPRWTMLFDDRARYTADELNRTVAEIQGAHVVRLILGAATALFAVVAALRIYRNRILETMERATLEPQRAR
ncbi:hypothetical protein [Nocardia cyriacigeorgica]|uniref:hypothetical protein n=1 Tax=Nocardia cyriacigeorgica TaxID=135487 RepID=UPI0024570F56|nr:hypothetical protein [Nocardia cyriacigeorgica]